MTFGIQMFAVMTFGRMTFGIQLLGVITFKIKCSE